MSLKEQIKENEGFSSTAYYCTENHLTIGYGFAVKDLILDKDLADIILDRKLDDLKKRIDNTFDWWKTSDEEVKNVVVEMCFQLGIRGFSRFRKSIDHLKNKRYAKASVEMLDSKWAKQTPNRAIKLSNAIKNLE